MRRILSRNGVPVRPGSADFGRKDVMLLTDEQIEILMDFGNAPGSRDAHPIRVCRRLVAGLA